MKIGIPQEIMTGEGRIALTAEACAALVAEGHMVYVQKNAGVISGYTDLDYQNSGAILVERAQQLYQQAQLIVKVKQPLAQDICYLRDDHILFSYTFYV